MIKITFGRKHYLLSELTADKDQLESVRNFEAIRTEAETDEVFGNDAIRFIGFGPFEFHVERPSLDDRDRRN